MDQEDLGVGFGREHVGRSFRRSETRLSPGFTPFRQPTAGLTVPAEFGDLKTVCAGVILIMRCSTLWVVSLIIAGSAGVLAVDESVKKPAAGKSGTAAVSLPAGVRMERDLAYVPEGDEAQRLDLYLPESVPERPLPLIVHIHGGGWIGGSKFPCPLLHLVGRGYAVASIEYRFSQKAKFPAQIQDCQAALRWLRAHSDEYHLNPDKVGVVGGSAGGHLSALVGMAGGKQAFPKIGGHDDVSDRVTCVCNIYGPANFATVMQQAEDDANIRNVFPFNMPGDPYSGLIGVSLNSDRDKTNAVSPVHYASRDNPPMLILHGTHDALVPYAQSVELAKVLKAQGVEVWLQTLPGSGHGGAAFGKPGITKLMQDFFDHHLQGADVKIALVPESDVAMPPPADAKK
jgi:acetyl esterase/lipase